MNVYLGYQMSADEGQEEYEEVQADLRKKEEEVKLSYTLFTCMPHDKHL